MKDVTFITTSAPLNGGPLELIAHLNRGFSAPQFKKDIIVLSGDFATDVFEWVDSETNPSYQRYADQHPAKEITEDRYDYYLDVLPPIYFKKIDGSIRTGGFCVAEAFTHTNRDVPVFTACYRYDGKFWETPVILVKAGNREFIRDYNAEEFSRDNHAISFQQS